MRALHLSAATTPDELRILRTALEGHASAILQLHNQGLPVGAALLQEAHLAQELAEEARLAAWHAGAYAEADEEGLRRKAHAEHREAPWCDACGHEGQSLPLSSCVLADSSPERRTYAYASGVSCDSCGRDWSKARALYGPGPSAIPGGPVSAYECYAS